MSKFPRVFQRFQSDFKQLWQAYEALGTTAAEAGPLDIKSRELIKLGMAAANGSLLLGITTIGFPTMMAALTWSQSAIEGHAA
jgi:hypothetical protein